MASEDVRQLVPRVRRAVEGPVPPESGALTDAQLEAMAADAIADILLMTAGRWKHTLEVSERAEDEDEEDDLPGVPLHWTVTPELTLPEESLIATQAAITFIFHTFKDMKVSESIQQEGRSWEWAKSASSVRDWLKLLKEQRDEALAALLATTPVLARYASILEVRDRLGYALIEPWTVPGSSGTPDGILVT